MRPATRLRLFASVLALALAATSVAVAAPTTWENFDITLLTDQNNSILLVAGKLPDSTKLPAEVRLSMPTGADVQWAGQLMGQDASGDVEVPFKKTAGKGYDIYTMTLTTSRAGQLEATIPNVTTFDGTTYFTKLSWIPTDDVPQVRISARVPASSSIMPVSANESATLVPGDATYSYFTKTVTNVKAGTPVTLDFAYTVGTAPVPAVAGSGSNTPVVALIVVLAFVAFVAAFIAIRRKATLAGADADDADDDDTPAAAEASAAPAPKAGADAEGDDLDLIDDGSSRPKSKAPLFLLVGIIAVAIAVGAYAGSRSTNAQNVGGAITRTYGTGEACTNASIEIAPAPGVNLAEQANALLAGLETVPGIGTATLFVSEGRIDLGYCDSSASEADLRAALASTGLVTVAEASTPTTGTPPAQ